MTADFERIQCSCCGKVDKYLGDCPNCWACGPEGQNHRYDEEVWSQEREDDAEGVLESAKMDLERIRAQRPADAMFSKQKEGGNG